MTSSSMVDWTVALSTASRLVKPGPDISREGAAEAVADLRRCAVRAEAYVRQVTGLTAAERHRAGAGGGPARAGSRRTSTGSGRCSRR